MPSKPPLTRGLSPAGVVQQIAQLRDLSNSLIEAELAARGITGIAPAHGGVLAYLFRQTEAVPIKDLVEFTGRAKSTVTATVQTLERHGYLVRSGDPRDSQVSAIELTARGRALQADFRAISARLLEAVYGAMPQRDREALVRLLATLEENLAAAVAAGR
jgi:MarR family transcriptional regulator, organic hydroperoxide resistance regulator